MASYSARASRRTGESRSRGSGRASPSSGSPFVARLQSTAGNRAVAQLLTDGHDHGPIDALGAHGNRAAAAMLAPGAAVQREDEKKSTAPTGDAKAAGAKKEDAKGGGSTKNLRKAWADAGLVAGGPLFDLINDDLSLAKLLDMGLPELGGLVGKGTEAAVGKATEGSEKKGEVAPIGLSSKEAGQVGGALAGWAAGAAQKWLKTEDGKKFLAKAQGFVNEHPNAAYWTIVSTLALGIAGAVTGYALGAFDPPEFKKQFEIRGIKFDAAADFGNVKEKVLQSGKLAMSFKAGPGTLAISGTAKGVTEGKGKDEKKGDEYGAAVSYAVGDEKKGGEGKGTLGYTYNSARDMSTISLGAAYKYKPLTLDTTWKFQGDGSGVLDTSVTGKLSDNLTLSGQTTVGAYGPASRDAPLGYKLSLTSKVGKESEKVSLSLDPKTKDVSFGIEQTRNLWGGSLTTSNTQGLTGGMAMSQGMSYARNAIKADLKYSVDKAGKESLETGVSGKGEGLEAAFTGKFGLEKGELEKLTVHLGFTTPDEMLSFIHDLSVQIADGKVESKATETIKVRLKQIAIELEGSLGEKNDKTTAGARAEVGWKLPAGLVIGAGVSASLTPGKEGVPSPWMVTPGVSVSHEALPIRLTGGVNVPVGPGSEGLPPVFGLSISPNFEFLGGKKKK
jgi:hypothetical protein